MVVPVELVCEAEDRCKLSLLELEVWRWKKRGIWGWAAGWGMFGAL